MSYIWSQERREEIFTLSKTGLSASQVAKRVKVTKNAVIGQLSRHVPRAVKKDKQTAKSVGSAVFVGPSAPRRFSWEEGI